MALKSLLLLGCVLLIGTTFAQSYNATVFPPLISDQTNRCVKDDALEGVIGLKTFPVDTCAVIHYLGYDYYIEASCKVNANEVSGIPNTGSYFLYKTIKRVDNCTTAPIVSSVGVTANKFACSTVNVVGSPSELVVRFNCPRVGSAAAMTFSSVLLLSVLALLV